MDGYGALSMLIKRQNADKNRKTKFRYELQKKREELLTTEIIEDSFSFPQLSEFEIKIKKDQIRAQIRKDKIRNNFISGLMFMASCLFVVWLIVAHTNK